MALEIILAVAFSPATYTMIVLSIPIMPCLSTTDIASRFAQKIPSPESQRAAAGILHQSQIWVLLQPPIQSGTDLNHPEDFPATRTTGWAIAETKHRKSNHDAWAKIPDQNTEQLYCDL
jgi:hypothetical protein